ncbi:MAG: ABC transporter permease [Acidobacteria bacterium]|jgi:putative ABC transport system permease protein|nr:ABC transporter permease [Acidobacteriota bacterium]
MSILMTLRIALKALARNKMRTSLTMLGMIIGVGAVITMVALGEGAQSAIEDQIRAAGTNMVTIYPGSFTVGGAHGGAGSSSRLTPADAEVLRSLPEISYVTENVSTRQQIIASNQNWNTSIVGAGVDFPMVKSWPMKYGTFFTEQDVQASGKVIALGANVSTTLFGEDVDPTGQQVRVRNHVVRVIGVMASKGSTGMGQNQDDQAFMPYTTVMKKISGNRFLNSILASAASGDDILFAAEAVKTRLRVQHEIAPGADDDFMVWTADDMVAMRTQTTDTLTSLLAAIAGVSLLVGGIGIMNIMLVSVTERTREIGLRLAVGAKGADVLYQFLVEALLISLVGGGLGIAFGFGTAEFVKWYRDWPAVVPTDAVLLAFGVAAGIGVFFGYYPARVASALDPIEALRFE